MKEALKRIIVPLDPSVFAQAATETACRVAKQHDAKVVGVAVLDSTEIRSSLVPAIGPYYPMMIDAVQAKVKHADHVLHDCLSRFAKTCEAQGVEHFETEYEGIPAQKLLESAIFFDLVVAGLETSFHFETRGGREDTLDKILDQSSTPVLAVPANGLSDLKKVIIAFDGSPASARALHDFAAFAQPYDVEVLIAIAGMKPEEAAFLSGNAMAFLESHGIENIKPMLSEEPVEEVINDKLLDGFDLAVLGIHSRKVVKDYFVGSFAKSLIKKCKTPLFLSH